MTEMRVIYYLPWYRLMMRLRESINYWTTLNCSPYLVVMNVCTINVIIAWLLYLRIHKILIVDFEKNYHNFL